MLSMLSTLNIAHMSYARHLYSLKGVTSLCVRRANVNPKTILRPLTVSVSHKNDPRRNLLDHKIAVSFIEKMTELNLSDHKNREFLLNNLFTLSQASPDIDHAEKHENFSHLYSQFEQNKKSMTNYEIVNYLASMLTLKWDNLHELVKLLEEEMHSRVDLLSIKQLIKLMKIYKNLSDRTQMFNLILNRLKRILLDDRSASAAISFNDYIYLLKSINTGAPSTLYPYIEENLSQRLSDEKNLGDISYVGICDIFSSLAQLKIRPTPLLQACARRITELSRPPILTSDIVINTLKSLETLRFFDKSLLEKLFKDLVQIVNVSVLNYENQISLLNVMKKLRWRENRILDQFFETARNNISGGWKLNSYMLSRLIFTSAFLNFKEDSLARMANENINIEALKNMEPKEQLYIVWSMAALNIIQKSHLEHVLSKDFYNSVTKQCKQYELIQLLNLRGIAEQDPELLKNIDISHLDNLKTQIELPSSDNSKKFEVVKRALADLPFPSIVKCNIDTPYGFLIDCEVKFIDGESKSKDKKTAFDKCAIIYVLFPDTILNKPGEVTGYKQIRRTILESRGFKTIFLEENLLAHDVSLSKLTKTISDLITSDCVDGQ